MALRCAPVQISYLNHVSTSAVPNVDYILADEVGIPPNEDRFFTERVWRLPGSFFCFNYDMVELPPVAPPPSRVNGYVTFGCFGSGGKINDDLIAIWARLLAQLPGSRLYLRNHELTPGDNRQFMRDRFRRHGIEPGRLRLDGGTTRDGVMRSYQHVDISLDTWPYCGGNTIAESLHQGVPAVTWKGDRFASRYGASLLLAAGCGDLIGETAEEYVDIAVALARSPERLGRYRENLRSMVREFGLADAAAFVRKLEEAYLAMVSRVRPGFGIVPGQAGMASPVGTGSR
jgi:predicted O-linked N-acetylglucosamine transferase (SPINDLY family)